MLRLNRSAEQTRGELLSAANFVLLAADVAAVNKCDAVHRHLNSLIYEEFRRQLANLMRENAEDFSAITFDELLRQQPIPEVMLVHMARLVTFCVEGYMPGRKD